MLFKMCITTMSQGTFDKSYYKRISFVVMRYRVNDIKAFRLPLMERSTKTTIPLSIYVQFLNDRRLPTLAALEMMLSTVVSGSFFFFLFQRSDPSSPSSSRLGQHARNLFQQSMTCLNPAHLRDRNRMPSTTWLPSQVARLWVLFCRQIYWLHAQQE